MMANKQVIDARNQDKCYDYHQSANKLFPIQKIQPHQNF